MRTRVVASTTETIKIHELLKEHLSPNGDGTFSYKGTWDDESIAKAVNPKFTHHHAGRVRNELFGNIYKNRSPGVEQAALKQRITALEKALLDLKDKHNALALAVGEASHVMEPA